MSPDEVSGRQNALKYVFGRGSSPDTAGRAHGASPNFLAALSARLLVREGNGEKKRKEQKEKRGQIGRAGEGSVKRGEEKRGPKWFLARRPKI